MTKGIFDLAPILGVCALTTNNILIKNRYHPPRKHDLLDYLKDAKLFTKLNLNSRYHQIPIDSLDVWKTTFKTREGIFEWLVVHFGLTNALANFMRYMDDVRRNFIGNVSFSI